MNNPDKYTYPPSLAVLRLVTLGDVLSMARWDLQNKGVASPTPSELFLHPSVQDWGLLFGFTFDQLSELVRGVVSLQGDGR